MEYTLKGIKKSGIFESFVILFLTFVMSVSFINAVRLAESIRLEGELEKEVEEFVTENPVVVDEGYNQQNSCVMQYTVEVQYVLQLGGELNNPTISTSIAGKHLDRLEAEIDSARIVEILSMVPIHPDAVLSVNINGTESCTNTNGTD